jgi:hypothetical protein
MVQRPGVCGFTGWAWSSSFRLRGLDPSEDTDGAIRVASLPPPASEGISCSQDETSRVLVSWSELKLRAMLVWVWV